VSGFVSAASQAADALTDPFGQLDPRFAVAALAFQGANLVFRAAAWRNVLAAAHPDRRVPFVGIGAAYAAGVALNGFLPARGGEAAKVGLVRLQLPKSSVVSIAAAGMVVLIFDALVGGALIAAAWATDSLPSTPHLPAAMQLVSGDPLAAAGAAAGVMAFGWMVGRRFAAALRLQSANVLRGAAVLRTPARYLKTVVTVQAAAWASRIGAAFFLLAAFGLPASLRLAALVVVLGGLSTLVPAAPGGMGAQQLLIVYALHGTVAAATALSFSIGMQVTVTAVNTVVGAVAAMIVFRTLRPVGAVAAAIRAARR
jgi:glycosyltransferase 2 family protein